MISSYDWFKHTNNKNDTELSLDEAFYNNLKDCNLL